MSDTSSGIQATTQPEACDGRENGSFICPDCGLLWPMYEDVEEWIEHNGKMYAKEWGLGHGQCPECNLVVHEGFDEDYVIRL
jgi:hypothetical protein